MSVGERNAGVPRDGRREGRPLINSRARCASNAADLTHSHIKHMFIRRVVNLRDTYFHVTHVDVN